MAVRSARPQAGELAEQSQVLAHGHDRVQAEVLRREAEQPTSPLRTRERVDVTPPDTPA